MKPSHPITAMKRYALNRDVWVIFSLSFLSTFFIFLFWKGLPTRLVALPHVFALICDRSSPNSEFLRLTLFPLNSQLFSTINDLLALAAIFTPSGLWNHNLASHCPPLCSPTSKKSLRHSRATLKVPSCFISQIAKVSKVSQRDSLDKGGMKADLLWVSQIFALIYWHKDTCVMCVLHMMVADLNVFLARASWTKTGQTSIQV